MATGRRKNDSSVVRQSRTQRVPVSRSSGSATRPRVAFGYCAFANAGGSFDQALPLAADLSPSIALPSDYLYRRYVNPWRYHIALAVSLNTYEKDEIAQTSLRRFN